MGRKPFIALLSLIALLAWGAAPSIFGNGVPLSPDRAQAAALVQQAQNVELVGHIGGSALAVAVQGNYIYAGIGPELAVMEFSGSGNLSRVGYVVLPDSVSNVAVSGNYVYVAAEGGGLRIIDISNPANPIEVGSYDTPGDAEGVAVAGDYAYVVVRDKGLRIINISNPANPTEVSSYDLSGDVHNVAVAGSYVYVPAGYSGLRIINVSNPVNPTEVGTYKTQEYAFDVAVAGSYAYVTEISGGFGPTAKSLIIIDVSNPANPIEVSSYDEGWGADDVEVVGDYAYVTEGNLRIIDISNPANPTEVGSYDTPGHAFDVAVAGFHAYMADGNKGLRIIDISKPSSPIEVGAYEIPEYVSDVAVAGAHAYVAGIDTGLFIIDVSNPANPNQISFYNTPGVAFNVAVAGSYAYVAVRDAGLRIINIASPISPTEVGAYERSVQEVVVAGHYAYIADGDLRIIDISNPASPTEVGSYNTPGTAVDIAVADSYAYVADGGLRIIDISTPSNPIEVGSYNIQGSVNAIAVAGPYAYVADGPNGLRIIDISNPANPTQVGFYDTRGEENVEYDFQDVAIVGSYAYLASEAAGLRIIDVSNPANPTEVGFYDTPWAASRVAVAGSFTYVADGYGGLIILRFIEGAPPLGASISGQVVGGSGVPMAEVTISDDAGHTTTTDSNGRYTLSGLAAGTYTIMPSKSGYTFSPASRTVTVPPDATGVDFVGTQIPSTGKTPIVFVHGWLGFPPKIWGCKEEEKYTPSSLQTAKDYFRDFATLLKFHGYSDGDLFYAQLVSNRCYTPSVYENVPHLMKAIDQAKANTGQPKVILIAHSMGGLVSRAYIEGDQYKNRNDVAQLITLGTPHKGVPVEALIYQLSFGSLTGIAAGAAGLAVVCRQYQPVVCDFTYTGATIFNSLHSMKSSVSYHVISGNPDFLHNRNALAKALDALIPGPDDGIVPLDSGRAKGLGKMDRLTTDETHGADFGSWYYLKGGSNSYTTCIARLLLEGATVCGEVGGQGAFASRSEEPDFTGHTPFQFGLIQPDETITQTVGLDGGPTLFAAQWFTGTVAFTLVTPGGQVIDPNYAVDHTDVVTYTAESIAATYYLPNATSGEWKMVLRGIAVPPDTNFLAFAAFQSPVVLTAGVEREWYRAGETAILTATLTGIAAGGSITATVLRPDEQMDQLTFTSVGRDRYQASYLVPDAPGYTEIRMVGQGLTAEGISVERATSLVFQIARETFELNGQYTDAPVMHPDGMAYTSLEVAIGLQAVMGGTVQVSGDLVDGQGNLVAHAIAAQEIDTAGPLTVTLSFAGEEIFASRRDGPFILSNLLVVDQTDLPLVAQEASEVYTTKTYRYTDFAPHRLFLPAVLK